MTNMFVRRCDGTGISWTMIMAFAGTLFWLSSGCQSEKRLAETPTYPVTGTLLIHGRPVPGAMIKFYHDRQSGRMPTAIVRDDGGFSVSYYDHEDGSPAGEYQLLVVWMKSPPEGGLPQDQLQGRYSNPQKPVKRVTIVEGENSLGTISLP